MELVAATLFGLAVVAGLAGFHFPHAHVVAGAAGVVAALLAFVALVTGHATPLLGLLLTADVAVTGVTATFAIQAFRHAPELARPAGQELLGASGVALQRLDPAGTVRVRGEVWSAVADNPPVPKGGPVHVIGREGIHLEVLGEAPVAGPELFAIEPDELSAGEGEGERKSAP